MVNADYAGFSVVGFPQCRHGDDALAFSELDSALKGNHAGRTIPSKPNTK